MLLNNKIATLLSSALTVMISINCQAKTPIVSCPATFSDGHNVYQFKNASVFDGPIELNAELKPEFKKDKQYWKVFGTKYDPFLICTYANANHYIVFDAKGASFCEVTNKPLQARCMP
ncbi:STY0301 family protein [Snodgrassella alvi]|uniref:STY0301 family protein n=1 Tax=Snodgrassella alvi TaxID=1196083 RepID=A0ABD7YYY4_9NEIS|nr:STY0301 family protein [Snodgrassella alvi]UOO98561.1 hypothetical protein LVJ87_11260 [Snodgrassella alvi wkB2]WLS97471.1 STY0301 family protein [Snodgrassella alvi]